LSEPASRRPFAWERSYPEGGRWDAPIATGTLPDLLAAAAASHGDRTAIEFRDARITYARLAELADRAAAGFIRLGVRPGDPVALLLPNTPWHPIAFFGVLKAGGIVVHLSPLDPPRALARKMADSGAKLLVTTDLERVLHNALAQLGEGAERIVVGEDAVWGGPGMAIPADDRVIPWREFEADPVPGPTVSPDEVAVFQYTGGTTGLPRAAMLTHANLTAAVSMGDAWSAMTGASLTPDDRVILVLPLFHIYALTVVLLRPLSRGATLLLRERFDPEGVLHDIERGRATVFPGVPTMWIALANHPGIETRDLASLRAAGSGGAPLPAEVQQRFEALTGLQLGGGWGMTETSPAGTALVPGQAYAPGAIGLPLPGVEMDVASLDDASRSLPPGETGELRIRGLNVFKGYWRRADETAQAFRDGWFLTGDVGYMDADGVFYIVDRKKDMIISGGFNVYPRVIEEAVYEHPDVAEAVVIGVPHSYRGQAAKVFVTLKPHAPRLTFDELRAFLDDKLGRHEMPVALELRETLPRTPVGKLSRKELADEERARAALNA
jgi:long-chain acyl-CoA synthetase